MPGKGKDCALLQSLEASPTTVTLGSVTYYCHAGKRDLLLPRWEAWPTKRPSSRRKRSVSIEQVEKCLHRPRHTLKIWNEAVLDSSERVLRVELRVVDFERLFLGV